MALQCVLREICPVLPMEASTAERKETTIMKIIKMLREELDRHGLAFRSPIEQRRQLVRAAKRAARQGNNPRSAISRILSKG